MVTFHCAGSVPAQVIAGWLHQLRLHPEAEAAAETRRRVEAYLDRGCGEATLRRTGAAVMVEGALLHFDAERYRLHAWVIMPDHVHALLTPLGEHDLPDVHHSWKSFTAKEANRLLGRTGDFWQRESFDRFIRDDAHYAAEVEYIEMNPVRAGLCSRPEGWPFSSAAARRRG